MSIPHHQTTHLDDEIGFWIVAHVHKLDSHANWSAQWHSRRRDTGEVSTGWVFRNYECDADILREFIARGIVTKCVNAVTEHVFDDLLMELNEKRHEPNLSTWFELAIDTFTEQAVEFSFCVWAYKYHVASASLPKQLYYLFADRLRARVRFVHEWFALESLSSRLEGAIRRGTVLPRVASELEHELLLLKAPSEAQIYSSCRSLFPVLERAMREQVESRPGAARAGTLDDLIRRFESAHWITPETIELLRFVMKPKRDYIEHGRKLPTPIAKLVLSTLLEVLIRLGEIDA